MYMNGSGIEPYDIELSSENTVTLPTGVPCFIARGGWVLEAPLNGSVYVLKTEYGTGSSTEIPILGFKVSKTLPKFNPAIYFRIS